MLLALHEFQKIELKLVLKNGAYSISLSPRCYEMKDYEEVIEYLEINDGYKIEDALKRYQEIINNLGNI